MPVQLVASEESCNVQASTVAGTSGTVVRFGSSRGWWPIGAPEFSSATDGFVMGPIS
jgi:hypothetical protein